MPRISRKQIAKKREADNKSADEEQKKKKKKKLPTTLKECFETVDAGSIVLIASYLDIPPEPISANETNEGAEKSNAKKRKKEGQKKKKEGPKLETDTQEFGCIPWRLSLVHQLRKDGNGGYSNHVLKLALHSDYRKDVAWRADLSGTLTMKKWLEKMPEGTNPRKLNEHSELFTTTFTQSCQTHAFSTEFPLPIGGNAFASSSCAYPTATSANNNSSGLAPTTTKNDANKLADSAATAANANDDAYLKNRQFKFELNFLINNVEFSHTPKLDFRKNQPSCNAVINIGAQKIYVNKEYLSIYSPVFATMFSAEGFVESAQQAATLRDVSPSAFNELMQLIYDPVRQPDGNFRFFNDLLKIARCYLIQYITNRCEKRLLLMDNDEKTISVGDRMKLAEEYDLVLLKARLIVKNDADELLKLDGIISEETRQMLLRKKNVTAEEEAAETKRSVFVVVVFLTNSGT